MAPSLQRKTCRCLSVEEQVAMCLSFLWHQLGATERCTYVSTYVSMHGYSRSSVHRYFLAWPPLYFHVRKAWLHALHRRGVIWLQGFRAKLFLACLREHSSCAYLERHRGVKDVSKAIVQHLATKHIVFPSTVEELTRNACTGEAWAWHSRIATSNGCC